MSLLTDTMCLSSTELGLEVGEISPHTSATDSDEASPASVLQTCPASKVIMDVLVGAVWREQMEEDQGSFINCTERETYLHGNGG